MRNIDWIVLDDIKMNLVAALIILIFAASFNKTIDLPFELTETKTKTGAGEAQIKSTKILISKKTGRLTVSISGKVFSLEKVKKGIEEIDPVLPVLIAVEKSSGLSYEDLLEILARLKARGIKNVSLLANGK